MNFTHASLWEITRSHTELLAQAFQTLTLYIPLRVPTLESDRIIAKGKEGKAAGIYRNRVAPKQSANANKCAMCCTSKPAAAALVNAMPCSLCSTNRRASIAHATCLLQLIQQLSGSGLA